MNASTILETIIAKDQEIAKLQDQFDELSDSDKQSALVALSRQFQQQTDATAAIPVSMIRVVEMMSVLDNGPALLADGLTHPNEEVRHLFGEALISIANEDGVQSILPAVDFVIEAGGVAAAEMPFILAWIDDPAAVAQIHRFLENDDTQVVYAAIEACAQAGDADSVESLSALVNDTREIEVDIDGDDVDEGPVTIGMLAQEAISIIEAEE